MLYLGLSCGIVAGDVASREAGLNSFRVYIATLLLVIPALAGARLLFVACHWSTYRQYPARIWTRSDGGASMYGGLLLALISSVPLLHALRLSLGSFWDVASFTILVAMIFTRIGCFLNGCCCGRTSQSWLAFGLPDCNGKWRRRLPTQIFEAITAAALLIVAASFWRAMPFPGALFLFVMIGYSVARFAMEFARERQDPYLGIASGHAMSAITLFLSLCALMLNWRT